LRTDRENKPKEQPVSDATHRWAEELKDSFDVLKTLRDELKVQVHLASMDAKQRFSELEKRLDGDQLTMRKNLNEVIASFKVLKDELAKQTLSR